MPFYAGFDLGGTQLKYGVLDERLNPVFKDKAPTPPTMKELLDLFRGITEAMEKRERLAIEAVGFGFPGIFHLKEQKIYQSPNYAELDGFDLRPALERVIKVPFWIDNDANLAAYGEFRRGAGNGVNNMLLLTLGTGVGSGIIVDGSILHGSCGFAAEMGHMVVNPQGERCNCGSRGCLETEASAGAIIRNYQEIAGSGEWPAVEHLAQLARQGELAALRSFKRAGYYLGIALGAAVNLLNPEKILLGGGVMESADLVLPHAVAEAGRRCYQASFACCSIEKAALGNEAGFIGAAGWARDQLPKK